MDYLSYGDITDDLVVIKINKSYYKGMSPRELYEYTRGFWKRKIESVSAAKYALAVANGEVKEVYAIERWVHASQADNIIREYNPFRYANRIAFFGEVAPSSIREKYINKSVKLLFKPGEASPVKLFLKNQ